MNFDMRIILIIFITWASHLRAQEDFPAFQLKWNNETLNAVPIGTNEGGIEFWTSSGESKTYKLDAFSNGDQEHLKKWRSGIPESPVAEVRNRADRALLRILFVGNSYSFDLPKVFGDLAKANGKRVLVQQFTNGGWTLAKHAKSEKLERILRDSKWDIVVLQEQSQTPAFPRQQRKELMETPAKKLVDEIREADAIPVFFLTWGRRDGDRSNFADDTFEEMQKRLNAGYSETAEATGGCAIVPVGKVWATQVERGDGKPLYRKDGSHPSKLGSQLAALIFYTSIYGRLPETLRVTNQEDRELIIDLGRHCLPIAPFASPAKQ